MQKFSRLSKGLFHTCFSLGFVESQKTNEDIFRVSYLELLTHKHEYVSHIAGFLIANVAKAKENKRASPASLQNDCRRLLNQLMCD